MVPPGDGLACSLVGFSCPTPTHKIGPPQFPVDGTGALAEPGPLHSVARPGPHQLGVCALLRAVWSSVDHILWDCWGGSSLRAVDEGALLMGHGHRELTEQSCRTPLEDGVTQLLSCRHLLCAAGIFCANSAVSLGPSAHATPRSCLVHVSHSLAGLWRVCGSPLSALWTLLAPFFLWIL